MDGGEPDKTPVDQPRLTIAREQRVLGQVHLRHRTMAQPLVRYDRHAQRAPRAGAEISHRQIADLDRRRRGRRLAGQGMHQLALAVARDPGDTQDLTLPDGKRNVVDGGTERPIGRDIKRGDDQQRGADGRGARALQNMQLRADHQFSQMRGAFCARIAGRNNAARAQDRRTRAKRSDFLQFMADIKDGAAFFGEAAQSFKQGLRLLRRQHRGRLVHDDQLGSLQQAAQDFDALALRHGEIEHEARGVDRQAVAFRDLLDTPREDADTAPVVDAECHVFRDREGVEQREMLKHHADAERAGMGR